MTSTRFRLGDLIEQYSERCGNRSVKHSDISGVNRDKEFFPSKLVGENVSNYKVVPSGYFACNLMHVGRDVVLPIAYNSSKHEVFVSPAYTVFSIKNEVPLNPRYLEMWFKSDERDRYFWMHTDSSIRDGMTFDDMCDIEIDLPPVEVQKKYVDIYNAMVTNQACYERGLEDLKLTCEGYIEDLRRKIPLEKIGNYIECTDRKTNNDKLAIMGISNKQTLQPPNSRVDGVDKKNYLQIDPREFGYSPIHINEGSIALNDWKQSFLLSPIYKTFKVKDESKLLPEYLMLWFSRSEFVRYCNFHAFGSARDTFDWVQMLEVTIPIPSYEIQQSITSIFKVYTARKRINDCLKKQIKDICPILIKGSLEEANK